jgi:uncharacterized membrane protein
LSRLHSHIQARPRLLLAVLLGSATALALPATYRLATRALLGWNVAVWLYLALVGWMMLRANHERLRRVAIAQAEGAGTVLAIVSASCIASFLGVVLELSAAKVRGVGHPLSHIAFGLGTVAGAWLLLPTVFELTYASQYYRSAEGHGLQFPGADKSFRPDYLDFLYFSFTIAVAAQTSDVSVTTPTMRRLVLLQSVLSFAFNTAILAFTVNIAAGLL